MASAPSVGADSWQDLGFANLQQVLDEQSSKINASQEEGAASRKALSAKTKAFRKLADDEKLGEIRGLLKSYQAEIDALTGRCKFAETCFMNAYKSLALLPDPAPLLNSQRSEIERLKNESSSGTVSSEEDSRLARELERQTLRVAQLEKQLRASSSSNSSATNNTLSHSKESTQFAAANGNGGENTDLEGRINALETQLAATQAQLAKSQTALKEESAISQRHQQDLRSTLSKLAVQQDYEAIKQELAELRSRERSPDLDDETENTDNNINTDTSLGSTSRLGGGAEGDIVALRKQTRSLEAENVTLRSEQEQLAVELKHNRQLVAKLEEDLSALQPSDTFSTISGWTAVPRAGPGSLAGGGSSSSSVSGGSAVSGIIVQQRDRYKKRMQELEEKVHTTESALAQNKKELETVKRESYRLYDRVRQLQAAVPSAAAASSSGGSGQYEVSSNFEPKSLYEPLPEQQLKELDLGRRTMGMSALNAKYVELCARALVDPKVRTGVAAYAAAIHLLALLGIFF